MRHRHRLALTLIHLVGIPVTNTSVNPARSIGPALFEGCWAFSSFGFSGPRRLSVVLSAESIYRWLSDEPRGQVTGTSV